MNEKSLKIFDFVLFAAFCGCGCGFFHFHSVHLVAVISFPMIAHIARVPPMMYNTFGLLRDGQPCQMTPSTLWTKVCVWCGLLCPCLRLRTGAKTADCEPFEPPEYRTVKVLSSTFHRCVSHSDSDESAELSVKADEMESEQLVPRRPPCHQQLPLVTVETADIAREITSAAGWNPHVYSMHISYPATCLFN